MSAPSTHLTCQVAAAHLLFIDEHMLIWRPAGDHNLTDQTSYPLLQPFLGSGLI